jgi:hypothetical protein
LNDKNSMKMLCLEIFPQKKFWWNCLQKQTNHGKHSYFPFCFRPVFGRFSAAFVQNRRQYSRKIFQVSHFFFIRPVLCYFDEFSAGWQPCIQYCDGLTGVFRVFFPASLMEGFLL